MELDDDDEFEFVDGLLDPELELIDDIIEDNVEEHLREVEIVLDNNIKDKKEFVDKKLKTIEKMSGMNSDKMKDLTSFFKTYNNEFTNKEEIIIQAMSWNSYDEMSTDNESYEDEYVDDPEYEFNIYIHGIMSNGSSIAVRVTDFRPYFYIELPSSFNDYLIKKLVDNLKETLGKNAYGLVNHEVVSRCKLFPYTRLQKFKFIKFSFKNMKTFRYLRKIISTGVKLPGTLEPHIFNIYETKLDPILRFCHIQNITTCGFFKIGANKYIVETEEDTFSKASINITTSYRNIIANEDQNLVFPIRNCSWDIECRSSIEGIFPNSLNPADSIAMIGITVYDLNLRKFKIIVTDKKCNINFMNDLEVYVLENHSEKDLLITFTKLIDLLDPDIISGYNTWGFDDNYLMNRLKLYNLSLNTMSRFFNKKIELLEKELSSSAYGNNKFNYIMFPGRQTFDLYVYMRREHKLGSYKLDNVSLEFLNQKKDDLPYNELFIKLNGNEDDIAIASKYCVQDTNLVIDLLNKLFVIPNYIEMAKTTCVIFDWLLFRGQQCKIFSLISKKSNERNFLISDQIPSSEIDFKGASVLEPQKGSYHKAVAGLDFASLYPSIMIAFNFCYSTFVTDPSLIEDKDKSFIEKIEWKDSSSSSSNSHSYTFIQHNKVEYELIDKECEDGRKRKVLKCNTLKLDDPDSYQGILPSILQELWSGRKATKKLMNKEQDPFIKQVLNGKQLSQKIVMNSLYGFTGANKGILPCKEIACCVTARGREMIEKTAELAVTYFSGANVLYGDSIPSYEKIPISSDKKNFYYENISEILKGSQKWNDYRLFKINNKEIYGKEYFEPEGLYTLSKNGPTLIKKIIRHKVPKKRLFKITTKSGTVIVTEGHSLIKDDCSLVRAEDLIVGDSLHN